MKLFKILSFILALTIFTGCDLKINLNSNLNQTSIEVDSQADEETSDDQGQTEESQQEILDYEIITTEENMIEQIKNKSGEIIFDNLSESCGLEVMVYAQPDNQSLIILKPFDPGSDKYLNKLLVLNLREQTCQELEISQELTDFGSHVLSADQTKLALALETNEARQLKLLDLVYDKATTLVELTEGETLNGGYGAMTNHFDIKWLDETMIQYTVFKDTYENYAANAPDNIEKVLQVRVINIE